ncbi:PREDICTED: UPF0481 [Prunus dulcis]|uniref:PREDICTED: UPF0481 n=1 Tax=Prunus dulcis TaxID=3755 RepID=A0A5E4G0X1_PRUDU|nr:UPF0481 protein At3g47200-like [Prunus dulcis]VVA33310.1 PREDICTED: UPF0481 [Prunus dulcis]
MAIETECSADRTCIVREDTLLEALKEMMRRNAGPDTSPLPPESCIFKVPEALRMHNPKAYEPYVVSIGPFHRGRDHEKLQRPYVVSIGPFHRGRDHEKLQRVETVKQWYLDTLLARLHISSEEFIQRINDETENGISEFEKQARSFYAEPLDHSEEEFMEIMILDGCFVIHLLWKIVNGEGDDDPILNMDCMFQYVCHDLLLLENQLPWFVLECLYRLTLGKIHGGPPFSVILTEALSSQNSLEKFINKTDQKKESLKKIEESIEKSPLHILDLIRFFIALEFEPKKGEPEDMSDSDIPPATGLSEAGVKFKKGDSADNLLNIKFVKRDLIIPQLPVSELTEPLLRNLIAFEQCYHGRSHRITSYAVFMDKLISSDKDIKLLTEENILANWLNVEDGSKFFNSLYIDTTVKKFEYHKLCANLKTYNRYPWNRHLEEFRRDYCSTPWKVIALTVGILLLVVNLMQFLISLQSSTLFTGIRVNELSADI